MSPEYRSIGSGFPQSRRQFIRNTAAAGAALTLGAAVRARAEGASPNNDLNIAIVGVGKQGSILLHHILKVEGVRVQAVCDIWEYTSRRAQGMTSKLDPAPSFYTDLDEMLAGESDLDAVIIATPDFVHHEHTIKCLKAGLHVYCEKEMSNDIELARQMVQTARGTGKLLQIGHQRRSNPYYRHAHEMIHKERFFGDLISVRGQWNQKKPLWPIPEKLLSKYALPEETLNRYGYGSMAEFTEWRWFKKYAGGPMTDLGSHQVDIFSWFLGAAPTSVYAVGSAEYAIKEAAAHECGYVPECFDHTIALYEFAPGYGKVYGTYEVDLRTSHGGFYEEFMGSKGSMLISEVKERNRFSREKTEEQPEWVDEAELVEGADGAAMTFDPLASRKKQGKMDDDESKKLAADMEKPAHLPHLENFFDAIRDSNVKLTCPGEVAFETCVAVLKANEAATTGGKLALKPEDFVA